MEVIIDTDERRYDTYVIGILGKGQRQYKM